MATMYLKKSFENESNAMESMEKRIQVLKDYKKYLEAKDQFLVENFETIKEVLKKNSFKEAEFEDINKFNYSGLLEARDPNVTFDHSKFDIDIKVLPHHIYKASYNKDNYDKAFDGTSKKLKKVCDQLEKLLGGHIEVGFNPYSFIGRDYVNYGMSYEEKKVSKVSISLMFNFGEDDSNI